MVPKNSLESMIVVGRWEVVGAAGEISNYKQEAENEHTGYMK